jgi:hypothetical protein
MHNIADETDKKKLCVVICNPKLQINVSPVLIKGHCCFNSSFEVVKFVLTTNAKLTQNFRTLYAKGKNYSAIRNCRIKCSYVKHSSITRG